MGGYRSKKGLRSIKRNARRLYRRHTKYKGLRRQPLLRPNPLTVPHTRMKYDGWGLPLPHPQDIPSSVPTTSCILSQFLESHDPSYIVKYLSSDMNVVQMVPKSKRGRVKVDLRHALISSTEYPLCFSNSKVESKVIVDTGVFVWISPNRTDFSTYAPSNMKIKNLSSTNTVAGEGLIRWDLQDESGYTVTVQDFSYHIPAAKVRLLSPQVLIQQDGGRATKTKKGI